MAEVINYSLFSDFDIDLFKSGKHYRLYEKFGSHPVNVDGVEGTYFAVWAPSAKSVSVIGDFNFWNEKYTEPIILVSDYFCEFVDISINSKHAELNNS